MEGDNKNKTKSVEQIVEALNKLPPVEKKLVMKKFEDILPPRIILGDVSWFARSPVSNAKAFKEKPSMEEYIVATRIGPMQEALTGEKPEHDPFVDYDLSEEIDVKSEFIILRYQIDRYSELDYEDRKYQASTMKYENVEFDSQETVDNYCKENGITQYMTSRKGKDDRYVLAKPMGNIFTAGDILEHVYRFYSSIVSNDMKSEIAETDDGWGYSATAKESLENGTVMYLEEVMGDCMHFEGLRFIEFEGTIPVYQIMFGS